MKWPARWWIATKRGGVLQVDRGADEPDVTKGLGKVAQQLAGDGIDLLRQETDVVAAADQALEQPAAVCGSSPTRAKLSTSQKLQIVNVASGPGKPSHPR